MTGSNAQRENRFYRMQSLEVRASDDSPTMITGYAAVFDIETDIGGYFREKIAKGAFTEALGQSDVHALYNHNYDRVLGRMKSKTLRISEDDRGLRVEIDLPDTQEARDLGELMERGDIDEMSFGFSMDGGKQEWDDSGETPLRTIIAVGELYDVSVCPRGAYPDTECGLRSLENHRNERKKSNFSAAQKRVALKKRHLAT